MIYLNVPFSEKEEAKSLFAKWDAVEKRWVASKGKWNKYFCRLTADPVGRQKNYGMALQLERKYDRLVIQKSKIKKRSPLKDFSLIWMHSIGTQL